MPPERSFIFYDPTGRRWARFRRALQTGGIVVAILAVLFAILAFGNVQLPALGLPQLEHLPASFAEVPTIIAGERAGRNVPFRMRRAARHIQYVRSPSPLLHPKTAARVSAEKPIVFGFYVNWDPASMVSLRINLAHLTHLVAEWFALQNGKGDLEDGADSAVIEIAQQAKLPILGLVSNYRNGWQIGDARRVLTNPDARANLIDNIYNNLKEHSLQGVNIDLEGLETRDREPMVQFMRLLYSRLHPAGLLVTQSAPPDDPAYDLKRLAESNDYLVPMVYDEHYQSSEPGPVASEQWFEDQLDRLAKTVPPEKTVIGMGNYGYDWTIGGHGSAEMTFGAVMAAAVSNHGQVQWDEDTENPVLRYFTGGHQHEVWFLDAVSGLNQALYVADAGFRGIGLWRLGGEDPGLWKVLQPGEWPAEDFNPAELSPLSANKTAIHYGDGEVLHITETPREGNRAVSKDADGDFHETFGQIPTYWVIEHRGKPSGKRMAITFDDGPDPEWTPRILDALRQRNVRATFFVIGANAARNAGLIKREYDEGHEIGNHSYSHPNIALVSDERARLELNWTQRIIENAVGAATTMFRPPYNADSDPTTPEEILPVWRAQQEGYITIGETIDPRDWEPGTTADRIVSQVEEDQQAGNVILLHDGGGDRSTTLDALPRIIDYFRGQGYEFLPVGELIGRTRAQVMPIPSKQELRWARIEGRAFGAESNFKKAIGVFFLWAIYLTLLRTLVFGTLAIFQKRRARRRRFHPRYQPPVSVIIAAYNEEKVIVRTVESVLRNGYDDLEIVVVNDGSEDATLDILRENYGRSSLVRILDQPNRGKSAALNNAIAHASHEILIAIDADTIFRRGTVENLVRHFEDPGIGAVSGNARVGNRNKWITRFQAIEYIYGFNLDRRALDLLNAITVVPGAVGAWRKPLILELSSDTTRRPWHSRRPPKMSAAWPNSASAGPLAHSRRPGNIATRSLCRGTDRWASWPCPASGSFRYCSRPWPPSPRSPCYWP
ncbi:MAG: glycosyltransferase [Acidobacteriia bacterium]|nr:glycosyltransferase [Terriglobia bacterium]